MYFKKFLSLSNMKQMAVVFIIVNFHFKNRKRLISYELVSKKYGKEKQDGINGDWM